MASTAERSNEVIMSENTPKTDLSPLRRVNDDKGVCHSHWSNLRLTLMMNCWCIESLWEYTIVKGTWKQKQSTFCLACFALFVRQIIPFRECGMLAFVACLQGWDFLNPEYSVVVNRVSASTLCISVAQPLCEVQRSYLGGKSSLIFHSFPFLNYLARVQCIQLSAVHWPLTKIVNSLH